MAFSIWLLPLFACLTTALKTCVMPKSTNGTADDTPGIVAAIAACGNNSTYLFSAHTTYNLYTPLSVSGLSNVEFLFEGNITIPEDVTTVQTVVNNTKIYPGHWITIAGSDVVFHGGGRKNEGWFFGEIDCCRSAVDNS